MAKSYSRHFRPLTKISFPRTKSQKLIWKQGIIKFYSRSFIFADQVQKLIRDCQIIQTKSSIIIWYKLNKLNHIWNKETLVNLQNFFPQNVAFSCFCIDLFLRKCQSQLKEGYFSGKNFPSRKIKPTFRKSFFSSFLTACYNDIKQFRDCLKLERVNYFVRRSLKYHLVFL